MTDPTQVRHPWRGVSPLLKSGLHCGRFLSGRGGVYAGSRAGPSEALWYAQQALQERWPDIRAELWRRARSS